MFQIEQMFSASLVDIKRGYSEQENYYQCLLCGERTEKGLIYRHEDLYFDSEKEQKKHIENVHGSIFEFLINMDKKYTGLSEHQTRLLQLFYEGKNDNEVKKELGVGSSSTIRNHRFILKEKERQAKLFLVLMDMLKEKKTAPMVQIKGLSKVAGNTEISESEEELLKKFFPLGLDGPLKTFQIKEKSKIAVLKNLTSRFAKNRTYTEKEVNAILKDAYDDFVTLRRYLIEYDFMERKPDGSQYWLKKTQEEHMDQRKELVLQYKESKKEAGVYQIENSKNGKVWVDSTSDLKTMNGKRFQLQMGDHQCTMLQQEWNEFGEEAFTFKILEVVKEEDLNKINRLEQLKKLKQKWLLKIQPFGDNGYNKEGDLK